MSEYERLGFVGAQSSTLRNMTLESSSRARDRIRVLLVDDHALLRDGTAQLFERFEDIEVVGQASTGEQGLALMSQLKVDVALVDVSLPGISGLEVAKLAAVKNPKVRILIVSAYDDYAYVAEALEVGVAGYLLKTASGRELVDAVRTVADGSFVLGGSISLRLAKRRGGDPVAPSSVLTPREADVLGQIARGSTNKSIANQLGLSLRTVEGYVSNVLTKLGVSSRTEAALYAIANHLLPDDYGEAES